VSHVVAQRRTRLEVEDAVQLIEQRLAHHIDQVAAVIGDDRIEAAVLFGRVVATLRRIGSVRLQDMTQARLQLRDQQLSGRYEVALEEVGEPKRVGVRWF
jgi:hypothetical protein